MTTQSFAARIIARLHPSEVSTGAALCGGGGDEFGIVPGAGLSSISSSLADWPDEVVELWSSAPHLLGLGPAPATRRSIAPSLPLVPPRPDLPDPTGSALAFFWSHEHLFVIAGVALSGLACLGIVAALFKVSPVIVHIAASKYPALAAAL